MTEEDGREIEIPENLPAQAEVDEAPLPETYERARRSLERCERVDECKDWGDKAQALVSYARQADDDELYKMARRIQGRAVRRAGELLEDFQNRTKGLREGDESRRGDASPTGDDEPSSQREAAEQAGMSKDQEKQARRDEEVSP